MPEGGPVSKPTAADVASRLAVLQSSGLIGPQAPVLGDEDSQLLQNFFAGMGTSSLSNLPPVSAEALQAAAVGHMAAAEMAAALPQDEDGEETAAAWCRQTSENVWKTSMMAFVPKGRNFINNKAKSEAVSQQHGCSTAARLTVFIVLASPRLWGTRGSCAGSR